MTVALVPPSSPPVPLNRWYGDLVLTVNGHPKFSASVNAEQPLDVAEEMCQAHKVIWQQQSLREGHGFPKCVIGRLVIDKDTGEEIIDPDYKAHPLTPLRKPKSTSAVPVIDMEKIVAEVTAKIFAQMNANVATAAAMKLADEQIASKV